MLNFCFSFPFQCAHTYEFVFLQLKSYDIFFDDVHWFVNIKRYFCVHRFYHITIKPTSFCQIQASNWLQAKPSKDKYNQYPYKKCNDAAHDWEIADPWHWCLRLHLYDCWFLVVKLNKSNVFIICIIVYEWLISFLDITSIWNHAIQKSRT